MMSSSIVVIEEATSLARRSGDRSYWLSARAEPFEQMSVVNESGALTRPLGECLRRDAGADRENKGGPSKDALIVN